MTDAVETDLQLPKTLEELEDFLRTFGFEGQPFFNTSGEFVFDDSTHWDDKFVVSPRLADWREVTDPTYEGLQDASLVPAELKAGILPGHLADGAGVTELFKDHGGNVYVQLEGVRSVDGDAPIFYLDTSNRHILQAKARN